MRAQLLRYGTKLYWRARLAKNRVAVNTPITVTRSIAYTSRPHKSHKLDIYRPAQLTGALPVIIFIHGGGFIMGDKHERRDICRELAAKRFAVFVINYRLSPKHAFPAAAVDTLRALAWVKNHASTYGGDPDNISLVGDSSGAHIAAIATCAVDSPALQKAWQLDFTPSVRPNKLVLYYGLYNLRSVLRVKRKYFKTYIGAYTGTQKFDNYSLMDYFSPVDHISPAFPRTLLIASETDPLCDQTIEMTERLKQNGTSTQSLILHKNDYPVAPHGFLVDANTPAARKAFMIMCNFLQ